MSTDPEAVQRQIERTREELGATIDELVDRVVDTAHPKNVAKRGVAAAREWIRTPAGMASTGAAGGLLAALVALRIRNGRRTRANH